mgnify:CR=1 FL=1
MIDTPEPEVALALKLEGRGSILYSGRRVGPGGHRFQQLKFRSMREHTPEEFQGALRGMSALSKNIAARDEQLNELLGNMEKVSRVLADRNGDLITLMEDGDKLFRALSARRESVHALLVATSQMSVELTRLVKGTRADLKPALDHLDNVVDVLLKNQENLDNSLRLMAPFYRVFANTLGTGPWFDTYIANMPPAPDLLRAPTGEGR